MTVKEDSLMLKFLKPFVVVLLTTILSLIVYLYQEVVDDVKKIDVKIHRLDSLALDNVFQNQIRKKIDSIQTAQLVGGLKELKDKIGELE